MEGGEPRPEPIIESYLAKLIDVLRIIADFPVDLPIAYMKGKLPLPHYYAIKEGYTEGILVLTNRRILFGNKWLSEGTPETIDDLVIVESVEFKNIIGMDSFKDVLQIIYRNGSEVNVIYFRDFRKEVLSPFGEQKFMKTVDGKYILSEIEKIKK